LGAAVTSFRDTLGITGRIAKINNNVFARPRSSPVKIRKIRIALDNDRTSRPNPVIVDRSRSHKRLLTSSRRRRRRRRRRRP